MRQNKPAYLALYESLREEIVSGILLRRKSLPARMCFHLDLPSAFEIVSVDVIPDE